MAESNDPYELERRKRELEIELEDTKSISAARSKLLEANIKELDEVYNVLREKLKELRNREKRIKAFEDELIRANKLSDLGELAGSIAHEIKNPLIAIQGFAKRIGSSGDPDKIQRYAKLIDNEAGRLSDVLAKLLEFSRMEEPQKTLLDLRELVDDTVLFMEHHLTRFKNIRLFVEKEADSVQVRAEKIHIQQALVNIIMNGAQAMPQGGVIRIATGRQDGHAVVSIMDEGTGISAENLGRIFEPFFTTKGSHEGTGLGLSICKKLIEANDGRIDFESALGQGTTFRIFLPLVND
jgi:signal transduction histidine kinase